MSRRVFGSNVLAITYVGELGRHLAQIINDQNVPGLVSNTALEALASQNQVPTSTEYNNLRPYKRVPQLAGVTSISQFSSTGASSYHALQISLTRRAAAGLTLGANYTYAHNLDNVTAYSNEAADGTGTVPALLSSLEYGNSDLDLRNRLNFTADYSLPFGKSLNWI